MTRNKTADERSPLSLVGARPPACSGERNRRAGLATRRFRILCLLASGGISAGLAEPPPATVRSQGPTAEPSSVESLVGGNRLEEAVATLEQRIATEGENSENLLLHGQIHYRLGRYEEALGDFRRSFEQNEDDPRTSKMLGLSLVKLGREDLAETFFRIAIELSPDDPEAHYYLGLNAYTTKRFGEAVESFRKAAALQPESVEVHAFLGRGFEAVADLENAALHYRTANRLNRLRARGSAEPPLLLGSMLFRQGETTSAERYLREALRYDGDAALAHYWLGLILERRSELSKAIGALRRSADLNPSDHRPHYALSRIHRRVGDLASAAEAVRTFRRLRARSETETY